MLIILLVVAIIGLILFVMATKVNSFWDSSGLLDNAAVGEEAINNLQESNPHTFDYAILFLFLGLNLGCIIAAVKTNFSPIIIFFFILLTLVAIIIAAGVVNIYQGLAQQPSIIDISSQLTLTNLIFSRYLPLIVSIISAIIMLVMYGKSGADIIS